MNKIHAEQEIKQFPLAPWLFSIFLYLLPLYILSQLQASNQPLTCLLSAFLEVLNPFLIATLLFCYVCYTFQRYQAKFKTFTMMMKLVMKE